MAIAIDKQGFAVQEGEQGGMARTAQACLGSYFPCFPKLLKIAGSKGSAGEPFFSWRSVFGAAASDAGRDTTKGALAGAEAGCGMVMGMAFGDGAFGIGRRSASVRWAKTLAVAWLSGRR